MDNMIDMLLEEVEEELHDDFSNFLEDYNIAVMLENENEQQNQSTNNTQQASTNTSQQGSANNTNTNTTNNNTADKGQQQNQNNNQQQANRFSLTAVKERIGKIFDGTDSFISKNLGKVEAGFKSFSEKVKGSETYKLADEISIEAIDFLSVPKQVCQAGEDLGFVLGTVDKWTGGLIGSIKNRGTELKNAAQQGLKGSGSKSEDPSFLNKVLERCTSIISGINESMGSIGKGFASIWKGIKATFQGKQESTLVEEEDELSRLLEESDNLVFLTLDEEVDYLLS